MAKQQRKKFFEGIDSPDFSCDLNLPDSPDAASLVTMAR
jgi:hypothetical protein